MDKNRVLLFLISSLLFPCRFLSHKALHFLGRCLGSCLFYLMPRYRKRALSNLSLATKLNLSIQDLKKVARESFQNLVINCLEYPKFASSQNLSKTIICENPELAYSLIAQKQGIVFFCGHQSNWEVLFLDGTQHMPGVAIGRPIKNPLLYQWVVSIRERFGGKIVPPHHAIKEGLRALKQGKFLGIVGDQGMPDSGFASDFLGRRAFTSPSPALLAYKTKSPLMVATTRRSKGKYFIHYSDPIWPDTEKPLEEEVPSMMRQALKIFEASILKSPGEWLWQHNRWKQETPKNVYYRYRHDAILVILPEKREDLVSLGAELSVFREIYPRIFLTFAIPKSHQDLVSLSDVDVVYYAHPQDLIIPDYRYKLVFNFTSFHQLKKHFLGLSAFEVISLNDVKKKAQQHLKSGVEYTFSNLLKRALCRPGTLWKN